MWSTMRTNSLHVADAADETEEGEFSISRLCWAWKLHWACCTQDCDPQSSSELRGWSKSIKRPPQQIHQETPQQWRSPHAQTSTLRWRCWPWTMLRDRTLTPVMRWRTFRTGIQVYCTGGEHKTARNVAAKMWWRRQNWLILAKRSRTQPIN